MEAEIITIGDEILIGQITDTNSAWIAQQLNLIGVHVNRITSVSDTKEAITDALDNISERTKLVLLTGGLGPTKDDLTKNVLADYFGTQLSFRPEVFSHIEEIFSSMGRIPSERNKEQALLPKNCRVLFNDIGTAPGMLFNKKGSFYASLPGVPSEMKFLIKKRLLPIVEAELLRQYIVHKTIVAVGVPESDLADELHGFEEGLPSHIKLAYLPRPGLVRLRLTAKGNDESELNNGINNKLYELKSILGKRAMDENSDRLEKVIGDLLLKRHETLATAESCTGGKIASLITSIPGSSNYFLGSIVAYSNAVKTNQLNVGSDLILKHGAVSEEVVTKMAEGARKTLNTHWAIATSGIAGPDGGSTEKPVGTVWVAISGPEKTFARKFTFGRHRDRNIRMGSYMALDMLRHALD